jgi:hypothetical protein
MESEATQEKRQELAGDTLALDAVFPKTGAFSNEKTIGSVSPIVCPHPDCRTSVAFVGTAKDEEGIHAGFHCKNGHRLKMGLTATEKGAELTITTSRQPIDARMVDLEKIWEDSEKRNSASNGG